MECSRQHSSKTCRPASALSSYLSDLGTKTEADMNTGLRQVPRDMRASHNADPEQVGVRTVCEEASVARMERSAIRVSRTQEAVPDFASRLGKNSSGFRMRRRQFSLLAWTGLGAKSSARFQWLAPKEFLLRRR